MKVLLVCKALHFTYKGGIQTHVWELSQALIDQGLDIYILTGAKPAWGAKERVVEGRHLIELPTLPGYRMRWFANTIDEIAFNLQVIRWLWKHEQEFDVIHFHGRSGLAWPMFFPGRLSKCLLTVHGLTAEEWAYSRKNFDRWVHAQVSNLAEKIAAKRLPVLIAVSQDQADRINERFERPRLGIKMIPNGIQQSDLIPYPTEKWIAFVGRIEGIKGVDLLPDILSKMPKDVGLFMIGSGQEKNALQRRFQELGLGNQVVWTGAIDPVEVLHYLGRSSLLLLPSRYEPQGRVILEAMSVGRPFVGSNTGGIKEMLRSGSEGRLVDPHSVADIVSAISSLLQNPDEAEAMGISGRKTVMSHYSWASLGPEVMNVYQELVGHEKMVQL